MPDMEKLLSAIDKAESNAYGSDSNGELSTIRARSIEDYLGEPYGDEVEGQSQVVSRDVFDTIESIKPALLRIFTGGDRVCKFEPIGPEDEQQAEQETDYINHVIQDKNDWFRIFLEWCSDALLTKNAYAMGYWDKSVDVEHEKYFGQTDDEFALLLQDPEVELTAHTATPDQMTGGQLHDCEVQRTKHKGQVKICVLPPERCKVDENTPSFSVKGANYFEYWDHKTVSEIREMGLEFDTDGVNRSGEEVRDTAEDQARDSLGEGSSGDDPVDPSMARHKVRMIWIRYDYNEDGIAELSFVIRVGKQILFLEECNNIPVASIVPTPLAHRHLGLSIRDAITDLQRISTVLWRQTLQNMYLANNGRYGVSDKVNLDDMLVSRAGGLVRVNGIPEQEIFPFQHPFIAQHSIGLMEVINQVRENRTGTNRYFNGTDQGAGNKTASGIAQLSSQASQRVEMIARVIAEGVKELFQIVHELIIKHADASRQDKIRLKGQWIPIDPSGWKKRSDLRIAVGLGVGNKEVTGANLLNILALQEKALPLGIAPPKKIYNALSEVTKNYGFPNPDAFWQDPGDAPFQMPDPAAAEKEKAQIQAQTDIQQEGMRQEGETQRKHMELEAQKELEMHRLTADGMKTVFQAGAQKEAKSMELGAQSQMKDRELQAKAAAEATPLDAFTAAASQTIEKAKQSKVEESLEQLVAGMGALLQANSEPFEEVLVRDPKTGAAMGKRRAPVGTLPQ